MSTSMNLRDWLAALTAAEAACDRALSLSLSPGRADVLRAFRRLATRYYQERDPLLFDLPDVVRGQVKDIWELSWEEKPQDGVASRAPSQATDGA